MLVALIKGRLGKYGPGQQFELPEKKAQALIRAGILRAADESNSEQISQITGLPKRQYRRRDMTAESI